jgi:hypothetical protein
MRTAVRAPLAAGFVLSLAAAGLVGLGAVAQAADDPWAGITWTSPEPVSPADVSVTGGRVWRTTAGLVAIWVVADGHGFPQAFAATRPTGGAWLAPEQISQTTHTAPDLTFAVNEAGDLAVAWKEGSGGNRLFARTRAAGGSLTPVATVAQAQPGVAGGVDSISVASRMSLAIGPQGQATVVFQAFESLVGVAGDPHKDLEIFATTWHDGAWHGPAQVSQEPDPTVYPICMEPDVADCPDYEGHSTYPAVAYDGAGARRVSWEYVSGPDEADSAEGIYHSTPDGPVHVGSGPGLHQGSGVAGDRASGFLTLGRTEPVGAANNEFETWVASPRVVLTGATDKGVHRGDRKSVV